MYKRLCIKLNNESGMALLVAMFVTFLSSIMLTFYMGSVIQESKHSVWQKERAQSLFLAEAGIQKGIYFDISGIGKLEGSYLGALDSFQILRADLSQGDLTIPGNRTGYGVLILEGDGGFNINGGSEWYGLILCHGKISVHLRGGENSAAHIYGALMIDDGAATMNGTTDIRYSSSALKSIRKQLVAYQVYAWCDGWGKPLGRFGREADTVASAW